MCVCGGGGGDAPLGLGVGCELDFLQVLLSKVLYEDCMTFLPECGADKSLSFISDSNIPTHLWIQNDSMYVRFGGIRNTKTWSKSRCE